MAVWLCGCVAVCVAVAVAIVCDHVCGHVCCHVCDHVCDHVPAAQVVKSLASWVAAITGTHSKRGDQAVSTSLSARLLAGARDEEAGGAAPDHPPSRYDALFAIAQTSETFPQLRRLAKKAHSLAATAQQ